jgi:hypothetical protein
MLTASLIILLILAFLYFYFDNIDKKRQEARSREEKVRFENERKRLLGLSEEDRSYEYDCELIKTYYKGKIDPLTHFVLQEIKNPGVTNPERMQKSKELMQEIKMLEKERDHKLYGRYKKYRQEKGWS